jgi:hypothetical protein
MGGTDRRMPLFLKTAANTTISYPGKKEKSGFSPSGSGRRGKKRRKKTRFVED